MGLQIDRLEKVRTTGGGLIHARCPACAVESGDTKGEHLIIYPDGRFGCCVNPGDKQHRKRIFALVGEATKRLVKPVVVVRKASATQSARQWKVVNVAMPLPQPPPLGDSELPVSSVPEMKSGNSLPPVGTLGTHISNPYTWEKKGVIHEAYTCEGLERLSQASQLPLPEASSNLREPGKPVPSVPNQSPKPYIDTDGNLRIPFDSTDCFHWWKGGQPIAETLREVGTSEVAFTGTGSAKESIPDLRQAGERETPWSLSD